MSQKALLLFICGLSAAASAGSIVLAVLGYSMNEGTDIVWLVLFSLMVTLWFRADCRARRLQHGLDAGPLLLALWPLALPYHLVTSRGPRGALVAFGFLAGYAAPVCLGQIAATLSGPGPV
jgi:hypothetical protein